VASNSSASITENQTFTTGVVSLVVGVLNPANSPQTVWDCGVGMTYAMVTTVVTGAPASFTILLEGTYDGATWTTLATTTLVAGETQFSTGLVPFTNLRARCTAVSGGTAPTVNVYATASQYPIVSTGGGTAPATTVNQGTSNTALTPGWRVAEGSVNPIQSLTNATTTVTGTVADFGAACQSAIFQVVAGAGVSAGAVTFFGSVDNITFVALTTASIYAGPAALTVTSGVLSATAPGSALVSPAAAGNNLAAIRYWRADVTTNFVGGNVNVKVSGF